jgi:hypothetical protein
MKTARPWLILFVAVAIAGYGCSSSGTTATTAPAPAPTTTTAGTTPAAGTTAPAGTTSVGSTSTSATTGTAAAVGTAAGAAASATGLTSSLSGLGLTSDQSAGALGSVLSMAQGKLSSTDYGKVAAAVPGASTYVQKAEAVNGGPVTSMSSAYEKLGISPEVGAQVTPLLVSGISKLTGPTVGGLLGSVIK